MPTVVATIPASDFFSSPLAEFKEPQMIVGRKATAAARGVSCASSLAGVSGYPGDTAMQVSPESTAEQQEEHSTAFFKHGKRRRSPTGETPCENYTVGTKLTSAENGKDKDCSSSQDGSHPSHRAPDSKGVDNRLKNCEFPKAERSVSGYEGGALMSDHRVGDMEGTSGVHESQETQLLRWGQRKRLRFARTDTRGGIEDADRDGKKRCRSGSVASFDHGASASLYAEDSRRRTSSGALPTKDVLGVAKSHKKDGPGKGKNEGRAKNAQSTQTASHDDDLSAAPDNLRQSHSHYWTAGSPERGNGGALEAGLLQERRYIQQCLVNPELVELPKFLLSLSRNEKEEDFMAIKGSKLPQRPRKRTKLVEKGLQRLLPGAWLCNLTRERYDVRERKVTRKKPRGLKAMTGNADSDTE